MMKVAALLGSVVLLGACASTPSHWVKAQMSAEQAYTELSECQYQVGLAKVPAGERELMVAHCMRGKGYRLLAKES